MPHEKDSFRWEKNVSAIAYLHDTTSFTLIATTGLTTAAATQTANAVINLSRYKENTLYVDSTAALARTSNSGLTIIFETRPVAAAPWIVFKTNSAVTESGLSAFKIDGSGIADLSSVSHFADVRITIDNISDSGSATVQAWMVSRTP